MNWKRLTAGSLLAIALSAQAAIARDEVPDPNAQLTPVQTEILKAFGPKFKIAVPTYVPAGMKLSQVRVQTDRSPRFGGYEYQIFYQSDSTSEDNSQCFVIEATSGGIGDIPSGTESYSINNSALGQGSLEVYRERDSLRLLSTWLGDLKGGFVYHLESGSQRSSQPSCDRMMNPQEAVKVLESLRYLQ